ncbi:Semaphorin-4E Semaphorin-7 Semaphorin-Z7 [Channa argus]|uniref:Semaphorin-4E Semaphorin-7 Semaphorin-Z7 n=1 Tax=Channa argus TaxID=215402 RepID=A0A6G1QG88_CHAAH|nr:Semaphorin-4E Semaphorin-7 Semaphorin-Z7 [Channa argus]
MILKQFKESVNLTALMIREDIGQLVVGAKGKVFTLSLDNIAKKTSEVSFQGNVESGSGKIPFDPNQRFASLLDGNALYSAGSINFLGTSVLFQRHGLKPIKTEYSQSWLYNPTMVSLNLVEVNKTSLDGEDDYMFLFFTEVAVEEYRTDTRVSRIARVCKSDLGGKLTLIRKWTSFFKARLDCPFGDAGASTYVQDVFLTQNQNNWKDSIFYATFTSSSELSKKSAVCAYKLSHIKEVFSGRFLIESPTGGWIRNTAEEPSPYRGSCINDEMRAQGVSTSLDLPDKTLLFVQKHPLMEGVVKPINGKPLLVTTGKLFTTIVIDQVTSLDGRQHPIMLIGTDSGWLQKAVRFDGEDSRIIEELQLFQTPQPVNFLQLSTKTGQLYSCSNKVAVQINLRDCSRYTSCDDCLLARDPYCGWDQIGGQCASVVGTSKGSMIQSLTDGDITMCPTPVLKPAIIHLTLGAAQFLPCSPKTNLPVSWRFSNSIDFPGPQHTVLRQGLIIRPSISDAGLYTCETTETVKGKVHQKTVIQYLVQIQHSNTKVMNLKVAVIALAAYSSLLTLLLCSYFVTSLKKANKWNNDFSMENRNNQEMSVSYQDQ